MTPSMSCTGGISNFRSSMLITMNAAFCRSTSMIPPHRVRSPCCCAPARPIGRAPRDVIMGVRPEHFKDAALVEPGTKAYGVAFTAHVEMLESLGSDKYAHFSLEGEPVSAAELTELAAEAGTVDVLGAAQLVARLPVASAVTEGHRVQVWCDPDQVQLFDPSDGRNLTLGLEVPQGKQLQGLGAGTRG